jgi:hypothetical protein
MNRTIARDDMAQAGHHQRIVPRRLNDAREQYRLDGSQADVGGLVGAGDIVVSPLQQVKAVSEKTEGRVRHGELSHYITEPQFC